MAKYRSKFLGVNIKEQTCCILFSDLSFAELVDRIANDELPVFLHDCTNWGGKDTIQRTCAMKQLKPTGLWVDFYHVCSGTDSDHCNDYRWRFQIDQIWELEEICNV